MNSELYREQIIDLYKYPNNKGIIEDMTHSHHENNPTCGDEITIYLKVQDEKINKVKFEGSGCAICIASTSLLTDEIKGQSVENVKEISDDSVLEMLQIPISAGRLKCALLGLRAVNNALKIGEN